MLGQEDRIRPCVGANFCLDRIYQGGEAYCIHNPATGRENTMPHSLEQAAQVRKVLIVGAGPAGLEAARVASARGHQVTVLEAADQPGGQIRLTALSPRRKEMMGIIHWRMARCQAQGVVFRFNTLADSAAVLALAPDVVIVATGGLPDTQVLHAGNDLVVSAWDILSANVQSVQSAQAADPGQPAQQVLLYDDAGDHTALQAAERIAQTGASLEIITPDRSFAPEVMAMNLVPYMRSLQKWDVTFTVTFRLQSVTRHPSQAGKLLAVLGSDYGGVRKERVVDQVVVNHGTLPLEDLYFALKPLSSNQGVLDYERLIAGLPQTLCTNPQGRFQLFRIGDAIAARNTHAAIYDALRLVKDL
jgi:NADPH-dependent 2,4-dienoyl-CoA reductase/sulfur reductase-like enzyme